MTQNRLRYFHLYLIVGFIFLTTLIEAQSWVQKANFGGGGRQYSTYFAIGAKGYIGFGNNNQVNDLWEYDPSTNIWTQKSPIPEPGGRAEMVSFVIGSKAYVGMGLGPPGTSNEFWEYDPSTDTWTSVAAFPGAWTRGPFTFTIGNKGYVGSGSVYAALWEYDPASDKWTQKNDIPTAAQRYFGVGFGIGSKGYAGTGVVGSTAQQDFWEYDPATDSWTQKADVGGGIRVNAVSSYSATRGYIATGGDNLGAQHNDLWEYDPTSDTWTQKTNYPGGGHFAGASFVIGCNVYLGVGTDYSGGIFTMYDDFWALPLAAGASLNVTSDTTICAGKQVILSASGGSTYTWSPDSALSSTTGASVTATPTSTITYTVTSTVGGCGGSGTVKVTVNTGGTASVSISANPSTPICYGQQVSFTAVPVNGGNAIYQWKINGANTGTDTTIFNLSSPNDSDVITCVMTSGVSCVSGSPDTSSPFIVNILPSAVAGVIMANSDTICAGGSVILTDSGSSGTIHWQYSADGVLFTDIAGDSSGIYNAASVNQTTYYRVSASGICGSDSSTALRLQVNALPTPLISTNDSLICASDSTLITSSGPYISYRWNNNDTLPYTYAKAAGGYWLTVTDANGCSASTGHLNIMVHPVPSVSIVVQGDTLSSFGAVSYQWYFNDTIIQGATLPVYIATQTGDYSVQIVDTNGCSALSNNTSVTITGLNDIAGFSEWNVYPNPFNQLLFIKKANDGSQIDEINIYDMAGRIVIHQTNFSFLSQNTITINAGVLPEGVYNVKVRANGIEYIHKVVKQ